MEDAAQAFTSDEPPSATDEETLVWLGARIRALRAEEELTLNALAKSTGISVSMLSLVERGRASPSIGTLMAISSALNTTMGELFRKPALSFDQTVIRVDEQPQIETLPGVVRRIVRVDGLRGIEIAVNEYEPGTGSALAALYHGGFEYGVVLEGILTVEIDGLPNVLRAGDHIAYPSTRPHCIWNCGTERARALWVNLSGSRGCAGESS